MRADWLFFCCGIVIGTLIGLVLGAWINEPIVFIPNGSFWMR